MLVGQTSVEQLIPDIPTIESFQIDQITLSNVSVLQWHFELAADNITALLPPALHPTLPPLGIWNCLSVEDSPWGGFQLVQLRLSCRSGNRPRHFLLRAYVNNGVAANELATRYGIGCAQAHIRVSHFYDSLKLLVEHEEENILELEAGGPEPLSGSDVQTFASMNAAQTPNGLRLVQFSPQLTLHAVERFDPNLLYLEPSEWGSEHIEPHYRITAWAATADIVLPRIRFVCDPTKLAFQGTEVIK